MSWKLFASTFAVVFVAELGDKTQLATFALSGGTGSRWTVFFAASLALIVATAIAVLAGAAVGKYVPEVWVKRVAGAGFIAMGLLFLISKAERAPESPATPPPAASDRGPQ